MRHRLVFSPSLSVYPLVFVTYMLCVLPPYPTYIGKVDAKASISIALAYYVETTLLGLEFPL
jgi:hypothetical protein